MSIKQSQNNPNSPPWEVLNLVSHHLDPKSLATASCVSKSWHTSMSSDHLWEPICTTLFPSLTNIRRITSGTNTTPYFLVFSAAHSAEKLRKRNPARPLISLDDLIFSIDMHASCDSPTSGVTIIKYGHEIVMHDGVFRFDIEVKEDCCMHGKVTWNVVMRGWRGVFTLMDCDGKSNLLGGDGWFSQELPAPPCVCSSGDVKSGIAADVKVVCCEDGRVEKVSVGILNVVDWRYVSVDDGLRYLQQFLLFS